MHQNSYAPLKLHFSSHENNSDFSYPWHSRGNVHVKGYAYSGNSLLMGTELAALFRESIIESSDFEKILNKLNGYFAVIVDLEDETYAAVDRVCSTPMFYRTKDGLEIGDNYRPFIKNGEKISASSAQQYVASGYTFGESTLLQEVKQIPAGSVLRFLKSTCAGTVSSYYRYVQNHQINARSTNSLLEELHEIHQLIFKRLVATLDGRQAVVPLSGGYDSRLIVEMLRHFGHGNVLCVTWGEETYWQVKIAQSVATQLGFPWLRVSTNRMDWFRWHSSGAMEKELTLCGALASIPYVQDNLLFDYLKKRKLLQNNAVFISGNSGDFIEGGHILELANLENRATLLSEIRDRHMRLTPLKNFNAAAEELDKDLDNFSSEFGSLEGFDEYWEWKERQSKFVSKCVKPFETNGFEWRMPFWDLELMTFWASVPRTMKAGRRLFYDYADRFMDSHTLKANPNLSTIERYSDALKDGRYGLFFPPDSKISSLLKTNHFLANKYLREFLKVRPLRLTRFNGLLALSVCSKIIDATNERKK